MLESVAGFREDGCQVTVSIRAVVRSSGAVEALGAEFRPCPTPVLRKGDLSPVGLVRLGLAHRSAPSPRVFGCCGLCRPDVVYVNTIIEPLWLVLACVCRVPVVCHVHEGESTAARWLRHALALPLLLAVPAHHQQPVQRAGAHRVVPAPRARCTVVYNGVTGPASRSSPPRADIDPPVRGCSSSGGCLSARASSDAVDAHRRARRRRGIDAELDIVGSVFPGYEWVEDDCPVAAVAGGSRIECTCTGSTPMSGPTSRRADILLVPSRVDEPFGNTAVEGALAARPVVATATSGLLEATDGIGPPSRGAAERSHRAGRGGRRASSSGGGRRGWPPSTTCRGGPRFAPARYRMRPSIGRGGRSHT